MCEGSAEKCSGLSASTGCLGGTMAGLEEKRPVSGESTDELAVEPRLLIYLCWKITKGGAGNAA